MLVLNHKGFEEYLIKKFEYFGGISYRFRFPNGYGASVVKHMGSYGHENDLWELAVIKFNDAIPGDFDLVYDTPITPDVEGYLTDEVVRNLLERIKVL